MCKDRNKLLVEFVSKGENFEAMQNSILLEKTTEFVGQAIRKRMTIKDMRDAGWPAESLIGFSYTVLGPPAIHVGLGICLWSLADLHCVEGLWHMMAL